MQSRVGRWKSSTHNKQNKGGAGITAQQLCYSPQTPQLTCRGDPYLVLPSPEAILQALPCPSSLPALGEWAGGGTGI